tara:strand:- start:306 stop:656 length:351 start_codon:yes stop_codon:yes gene_type:complete
MSELESQIQQWVALDNKLKQYNDKAKELRNARNSISEHITSYVETEQLTNATVEISDGRLRFQNTKVTSPLTFKFIEQCLNEVIGDESKVTQIIDYIKEKREVKYNTEIKRFYNKE